MVRLAARRGFPPADEGWSAGDLRERRTDGIVLVAFAMRRRVAHALARACAVRTHPVVCPLATHQPPPGRIHRMLPVNWLGERMWTCGKCERLLEITPLLLAQCVGCKRDEQHRAAPSEKVEPLAV